MAWIGRCIGLRGYCFRLRVDCGSMCSMMDCGSCGDEALVIVVYKLVL